MKADSTEREKWLKERGNGIGGSDAAAILGLNPYKTNIKLWEEKTGKTTAADIGDKECVKFGRSAEEHITALFALDNPQYEIETEPYRVLKNPDYPYIMGTLDAKITETQTAQKGVLEIKTADVKSAAQLQKWIGAIPKNYEIQCYHYLLVTNFDFVILKARIKYGHEILIKEYRIERADEITKQNLEYLLSKERDFWEEYVLKNKCPPLALPII